MHMKKILSTFCLLAVVLVFNSCKDDPEPWQAEVLGKFLAGEKDQSKTWKLIDLTFQHPGEGAQSLPLTNAGYAPFADNIYTFSNNDSQDYESTEGASKYDPTDPNSIEKGNWSISLEGLFINISVDETLGYNGLFSPDAFFAVTDQDGNIVGVSRPTYPYPWLVVSLTAESMVLEANANSGNGTSKYTLTFSAN